MSPELYSILIDLESQLSLLRSVGRARNAYFNAEFFCKHLDDILVEWQLEVRKWKSFAPHYEIAFDGTEEWHSIVKPLREWNLVGYSSDCEVDC